MKKNVTSQVVEVFAWEETTKIFVKAPLCQTCGFLIFIASCLCAQLCPTLCDLMNSGSPSSSVHGIF